MHGCLHRGAGFVARAVVFTAQAFDATARLHGLSLNFGIGNTETVLAFVAFLRTVSAFDLLGHTSILAPWLLRRPALLRALAGVSAWPPPPIPSSPGISSGLGNLTLPLRCKPRPLLLMQPCCTQASICLFCPRGTARRVKIRAHKADTQSDRRVPLN